ncbi:MAG: EF-P lysine aminoacylase EpmA [Verrucomicrobiota bacterium]|nr:EF-P lysine aminoacylase EpmA [Verrucomicrobiota bacterium]
MASVFADFRRVLDVRGRTLQAIRRFFADRNFLEVETPVRIPAPALEPHIDAEPSGDRFLRTSPELHMKRLLAQGLDRIFQMGPCFRRNERGRLHRPEFALLEWYRRGADYLDMLVDAKALIGFVFETVLGRTAIVYNGTPIEVMPVWERRTVEEMFRAHAGWNPLTSCDDARFSLDLVEKVEPALPRDRPAVLKDYPIRAAALARCRPGPPPAAERWELYIGGLELAGAFSELTDHAEQRARFEACARARAAAGRAVYPLDEAFLSALEQGLPPCGGAALGVDRLVMLLAGCSDIGEARPGAD